jgi:hypothetical protein
LVAPTNIAIHATVRRKLLGALGICAVAMPFGTFAQQPGKVWRVGFLALRRPVSLTTDQFGGFPKGCASSRKLGIDVVGLQARNPMEIESAFSTMTQSKAGAVIVVSDALFTQQVRQIATLVERSRLPVIGEIARAFAPARATPSRRNDRAMTRRSPATSGHAGRRSMVGLHPLDAANHSSRYSQTSASAERIVELAVRLRLPSITAAKALMKRGLLMSYGADARDLERRIPGYVDRILNGARPADMPVERPTRFELGINMKTAAAIGLMIPPSLLLRADEVIP